MDILSVLAVFLAEFLIGLFGAKWAFSIAQKMGNSDGEGFSFPLGVVLLLSAFVCVSLVFGHQLGGANSFFFYAVIAMGLVVMVLKDMTLTALSHGLGLLAICLVSSYFLPSSVSITISPVAYSATPPMAHPTIPMMLNTSTTILNTLPSRISP